MAGAVKHMERSHRSYKQNRSNLGYYATRCTAKVSTNKYKKSLAERLARIFGKMFKKQKTA